ncbi:Uma2 family endonuclease [Aquisphaera insulae]|uniref:Uma2 family endonuclease n=1 Tax=Aquisphaera insulae TaxID=2712864 RepID=UPI0013EDFC82|nr:Uma2 family endonuclease [Aquisphaera insulae]
MSRIVLPKPLNEVVYPDSDGRPMAENTRQFKWIVVIKENLEILYRKKDDVFIAGDLFWYAEKGNNQARTAPDVMVVFGRPKGDRGSYRQWEEGGIAPQVVFEVRSPSNDDAEMAAKFDYYDRHGVREYYDLDPDTGRLAGWQRKGRGLKPIARMEGFTSPLLDIRFECHPAPEYFRIFGPDGRRFLTSVELADAKEQSDRRAEIADRRAEIADRRAELLAAKLRELGIDPN